MKILNKTIGFIATMAVLPGAFALTSRVSMTSTPMTRMPTMAGILSGTTTTTTGTTSTTTTTVTEENRLCVDNYIGCLQGADVCGGSFEECTNNTLLFAKQGMCASTLSVCTSTAINTLYGTSSTTAFATKDSNGEYIYPNSGSVLGQMVEAAYLNNRYDTATCVRRYDTCLKRSDVCGSDFELCTTDTEFKKQKLFCESTLGRCQEEGILELFGTTTASANPTSTSRVGIMIKEGAELAAVNAVSTCYKVADQCILNTCATNPYKCKSGSDMALSDAADAIVGQSSATDDISFESVSSSQVRGFIENNCFDTIGANKYCYATFLGNGSMPTNADLQDEYNKSDIFAEAYASRMNNSMSAKIDDLIVKFEQESKERCASTISNCAMGSCGDGNGAACYAAAFSPKRSDDVMGVTSAKTLSDIKLGCESIVVNDAYCKYAGATFGNRISSVNDSLFDFLFTSIDDGGLNPDPIGVVGELNYMLSSTYNQASLDKLETQCESFATNCIRNACGDGFENCYRNRNDVMSSLTKTGVTSFDDSMNKVGGVLDYTVILGLCLNSVKNNATCNNHIEAEAARIEIGSEDESIWGGSETIRGGWLDAGAFGVETKTTDDVQATDGNGNALCIRKSGSIDVCVGSEGEVPYTITTTEYYINSASENLFGEIIYDLEKEAQAEYNAKLTKQQNMCVSGNSGVTGLKNIGGTFMWAKLRNNVLPKNYSTAGLSSTQFEASNEIYNSFCRIRVTLQSDDKYIQDGLKTNPDWGMAYFAAGDSFTCGSWISQDDLTKITEAIADKIEDERSAGAKRTQTWSTIASVVAGAVGGGIGGNALETKFGGLNDRAQEYHDDMDIARTNINTEREKLTDLETKYNTAKTAREKAEAALKAEKKRYPDGDHSDLEDALTTAETAEENAKKTYESKQKSVNNMESDYSKAEKEDKNQYVGATWGAVGGGVVGGVLGWGISKSATDAATENAQNEAINEWMDAIGRNIKCYIGADEVGSYGDIISTEME